MIYGAFIFNGGRFRYIWFNISPFTTPLLHNRFANKSGYKINTIKAVLNWSLEQYIEPELLDDTSNQ